MRVGREDYFDSRYKKLMEKPSGKKMIDILIVLTDGLMNIYEIQEELQKLQESRIPMPRTTIENLLGKAEKKGYVKWGKRIGIVRRPRGKPVMGEFEREKGRPPVYFWLTKEGLWLVRLDPRARDRWREIENLYAQIDYVATLFDSYANIVAALQKDPILQKIKAPYYFMDGELQRTILNPFVWVHETDERRVMQLYDRLVEVIKTCVKPEHYANYYKTLEKSVTRLEKIIERHKILIEKLKSAEKNLRKES